MSETICSDGVVRTVCPRCGKPWDKWVGSKLPCHAKCLFAPAEQDEIYRLYVSDVRLTYARLAERYGVTQGVLKAAITEAKRRAGERASAWGR